MIVQFGQIADDPRNVVKSFTPTVEADCNIYGEFILHKPTLKVKWNAALFDANYCFVPSLSRYYFINDIRGEKGEILYVLCYEDVLMTYQTDILNLIVEVGRSSATQCKFLSDSQMPIKTDLQVQNYEFSSTPFQTVDVISGNYLLTVIGGSEWTGDVYDWVKVDSEPADWSTNKFLYGVLYKNEYLTIGDAINRGYFGSDTDPTWGSVITRFTNVYVYTTVN